VSLSGTNAWTGTNSYNTNLPTSTLTPTTSTQLITKAYGDATYGSLAATQSWGGVNTFVGNMIIDSGFQAPTGAVAGYIWTSDASGNAFWSPNSGSGGAPNNAQYLVATANGALTNEVNLGALSTGLLLSTVSGGISTVSSVSQATFATVAGTNAFTGTNSFNSSLPTSTQTPTTSTQLITKAYGDASYAAAGSGVSLSGTNAWTGTNSYNTNLPTSTLTPTTSTQLITKAYGDASYDASGSATALLSSTNTWTAPNTFNDAPTMSGANIATASIPLEALNDVGVEYVQTTDATPTPLVSLTVTTNSIVTLEGIINCASPDYSTAFSVKYVFTAVNSGGTLTLVSDPFLVYNRPNQATPYVTCQIDGTGTYMQVVVTGKTGVTLKWNTSFFTYAN
jgi:hypothetical protein